MLIYVRLGFASATAEVVSQLTGQVRVRDHEV